VPVSLLDALLLLVLSAEPTSLEIILPPIALILTITPCASAEPVFLILNFTSLASLGARSSVSEDASSITLPGSSYGIVIVCTLYVPG
jgi:hypothetical protein